MKSKNILTKEEICLLKEIGLNFDYSKKLTVNEVIEIEKEVGDFLTLKCLDEEYNPNEKGRLCYQILDKIDQL